MKEKSKEKGSKKEKGGEQEKRKERQRGKKRKKGELKGGKCQEERMGGEESMSRREMEGEEGTEDEGICEMKSRSWK